MVESELLIGHLRSQVRSLQSLLSYLESREQVGQEDYMYSCRKLHEMVNGLKHLERFSSQQGASRRLQAQWWN